MSHSRTRRPRGLEEKLYEHVVPLTRSLSGSAVSIERTVYGNPSASLGVGQKQLRTFCVHLLAKMGRQPLSVHTEKNDNSPRHLYVDEKTMVCRKESFALLWTEQRNIFDLEGSQSGFAQSKQQARLTCQKLHAVSTGENFTTRRHALTHGWTFYHALR